MDCETTKELVASNYPLLYLNEEELLDPHIAIQEFFSNAHLPEVREMLWLSLKANVTGSFPLGDTLTPGERSEIVLLYEQLLKLVEAAHLLNEKRTMENIDRHYLENGNK